MAKRSENFDPVPRDLNIPGLYEPTAGHHDALEMAARRLETSPAEASDRLTGLALFLTGMDPAGEDGALEVLRAILGEGPRADAVINRLLVAETEAREIAVQRERAARAKALQTRTRSKHGA